MELNIVQKSVPRRDGKEKVSGTAVYTADLSLPGMLCGKMLRSSLPHARITSLDASRAEALPGVNCVLTGKDLVDNPNIFPFHGYAIKDQPVVAIDKVLHVGDVVAAVAAVDEATAQEALELIDVEYEELPAVFDPVEAMQPGAPLIHEKIDLESNVVGLVGTAKSKYANLCGHFVLERGDLERGFGESDYVFDDTFYCPNTQHCAPEPHATIATFDNSGKLTVWSSTQTPSIVRSQLAAIFKVPVNRVRIIVPYLGAGYGAKCYPRLEPTVAALAWKAKQPVRMVISREEVFLTLNKHAVIYRLKTGVKRDGTLVARECQVYWDTGAYADVGPRVAKKTVTLPGPYKTPNVKVESFCVYTNKPAAGAFRGFGSTQACWAYESQMDMIARKLGIDPLEIRLKNLVEEGGTLVTGEPAYSIGIRQCLDSAAKAIKWEQQEPKEVIDGKVRGRGLSCMMKSTLTPSLSIGQVALNEDGSATVITSTVEIGQGSDTILPQVVAEILSLSLEQVSIVHPDTDFTPYDVQTASSRSTFHMGKALEIAALDVKRQLFEIVAEMLETEPSDLEAKDGRVYVKGAPAKAVTYAQAMKHRFILGGGTLLGSGTVQTTGTMKTKDGPVKISSTFWFIGAGSAEVEVDTNSGQVKVLKYVAACDVGRPIHPDNCVHQIEGSVVTGLGQTFSEEMVWEAGQLINPNYMDYRLPSFKDIPSEMETILIEVPHSGGPFGAKGVGEAGLVPVSPAIGNAIEDAIGVRIKDLPITPEKILRALREAMESADMD